ncbi:MAG: hypothetical protein P1U58_14230 [Verrucomicrobiales bacterium]|nr:hypothetical protein [Verrucomicrobiales bacterium]
MPEKVAGSSDPNNILTEDSTKPLPAPAEKRLMLSNEKGLRKENPDWAEVEAVILQIDPGHGNSFCILESPRRGFVQALRGFNGYHLEWHEGSQHWRGAFPGGSGKRIELKKHDHVSQGEYRDLLPVEEVLESFLAFYRSAEKPAWLIWRSIEI